MPALRIGTSGWNYPTGPGTWNGIFYPKPRPRGFDELRFYAERFNTVEINSTFYGQPRSEIARTWAERTPSDFDFALKLYQKFTHPKMFKERELKKAPRSKGPMLDWLAEVTRSDINAFKRGVEPLARAGKLGAILAQFPASFKQTDETLAYVETLLRAFADYPVAVELRHRSWSDQFPETIKLLNSHGAAFVQIDEPKFRTSIRQNQLPNIKAFYYLRLHGRNAKQWWHHEHKDDRYNYLYSIDELHEFADTVKAVNEIVKNDVRTYFNNHYSAKAIANARSLQEMLGVATPVEAAVRGRRVESSKVHRPRK